VPYQTGTVLIDVIFGEMESAMKVLAETSRNKSAKKKFAYVNFPFQKPKLDPAAVVA
jgi:hypothetical protein